MKQVMLLRILRGVFLLVIIGMATNMAVQAAVQLGPAETWWMEIAPYVMFWGLILLGVGVVALDLLFPNKEISTLSAVYFGLLLGLLFGNLISSAIQPLIEKRWLMQPLQLLLTALFCYICVSTLVQTKDDFRFIIPYVEFSKQVKGGRSLLLDTSVIIDGRIADICDTRIIDNKIVVPRFVLQELQAIADSADKLKRNRGRRGLDMLKRMQNNPKIELEMHEGTIAELRDIREVDQRLVVMAKVINARVMTNDYNLNKIAQLQGVEVININELANALKSVALPGETMTIRLIKPGDQIGQGVGYLDDGTMVVAEQGRNYLGQEVNIVVTSVLQTPAGRMIFGRIEGRPAHALEKQQAEAQS